MADTTHPHPLIVAITTQPGFALHPGTPEPAPPAAGESVTIEIAVGAPCVIERLYVAGDCAGWRIDRVTVDGVDKLTAPRPGSDFSANDNPPSPPNFGTGSVFVLHVTNATDQPGHFWGSFGVSRTTATTATTEVTP